MIISPEYSHVFLSSLKRNNSSGSDIFKKVNIDSNEAKKLRKQGSRSQKACNEFEYNNLPDDIFSLPSLKI